MAHTHIQTLTQTHPIRNGKRSFTLNLPEVHTYMHTQINMICNPFANCIDDSRMVSSDTTLSLGRGKYSLNHFIAISRCNDELKVYILDNALQYTLLVMLHTP